jgi:hypothetical protein
MLELLTSGGVLFCLFFMSLTILFFFPFSLFFLLTFFRSFRVFLLLGITKEVGFVALAVAFAFALYAFCMGKCHLFFSLLLYPSVILSCDVAFST